MHPIGSETQPVHALRAGRAHVAKAHAKHRGEFHRTLINTLRSADAGAGAAATSTGASTSSSSAAAQLISAAATPTSVASASTQQQTDALLAQLLQSELESSLLLGQNGSSQSNPLSGSPSSFLAGGLSGASTQNPSLLLALMTSQLSGGGSATSDPFTAATSGAGSALSSLAAAASGAFGAPATTVSGALGAPVTTASEALSTPTATAGAGTPAKIYSSAQKNTLAQTLLPMIDKLAPQYGLSPNLVSAVIQQESGFQPNATSSTGAMGLMQLMPATANMLGVTNPYDPIANVQGGMKYLGGLLSHYQGDLTLALAAYNAGPAAVAQYGGVPPFAQTQSYVADIMSRLGLASQQPPG